MAYTLLYAKSALEDIRALDAVVKKRIRKKLELFSSDPFAYAKQLTHPAIGSYRFRVGNYRVVFDIDRKNIVILRIGHRREIYR